MENNPNTAQDSLFRNKVSDLVEKLKNAPSMHAVESGSMMLELLSTCEELSDALNRTESYLERDYGHGLGPVSRGALSKWELFKENYLKRKSIPVTNVFMKPGS